MANTGARVGYSVCNVIFVKGGRCDLDVGVNNVLAVSLVLRQLLDPVHSLSLVL
jgi:hypothetical protein